MGKDLIVHSTDGDKHNQIGLVKFKDDGTGTYEVVYHHEGLKYSLSKTIRGAGLEENAAFKSI